MVGASAAIMNDRELAVEVVVVAVDRTTAKSATLNRNYYVHSRTHEKRWTMPDEVRFHLSSDLNQKLLTVFNIGHLEAFKRYEICLQFT
jgi:hypothetical protein